MPDTAVLQQSAPLSAARPAFFRVGYVLGRRADLFWFLALPFLAVMIALQAAEQFERYTGVRPTAAQITAASEFSRA